MPLGGQARSECRTSCDTFHPLRTLERSVIRRCMSKSDVQKLTPRQKEILHLLLNGFDAKSAARELSISVHTVNEHLREARRQLGVSSSREAARLLRQEESLPTKNVGPQVLGVVDPVTERSRLVQATPNRRLAYAGGSLVILVAVTALAFSFAHGGLLSRSASPKTSVIKQGTYQYRELPLGTFDQLKVSGPFKVAVLVGEQPARLRIEGPPAQLADTIATVEGGILTIRFREGATWSWNPGDGVNIAVSAPDLRFVSLEGSGDVEVYGVRGDMFAASTQGAGSVTVRQLAARNVQLATSGAGGIAVDGRADYGTYVVGGSGSIDAKRLRVQTATIAVGGAGSAYADVSRTANVSVSGHGRVEIVGGATCIKQPANSPQVECR